ncbi:MAG: hypothetical protein ACK4P4_00390 [Allorhizobium sp.]
MERSCSDACRVDPLMGCLDPDFRPRGKKDAATGKLAHTVRDFNPDLVAFPVMAAEPLHFPGQQEQDMPLQPEMASTDTRIALR